MLIEKSNIKKYIPQREPFMMIDSLVSADETGFQSEFDVLSSNIMMENEVLSESALVENIAQTCAAGFGYLNSLIEDGEAKLGFIGAVTKLEVKNEAKTGAKIETKVSILSSFETIHLIEGIAFSNGEELVKCQMKIVLA